MAAALATAAQNAAIARLQRKINSATGSEKNALQEQLNSAKRNATARRKMLGGPEPNRVVGSLSKNATAALQAPVALGGAGASGANVSKYLKMLKMGVPLLAVKEKMTLNGVDSAVRNAFNGTSGSATPTPVATTLPVAPAAAAGVSNQGNALQQLYASLNNTSINALVTTISDKVKALIETAGRLRDKVRELSGRSNVSDDTIREVLRRVEAFKSRIRESLGRLNGEEATKLGSVMGELEQALDQLLQRGSPSSSLTGASAAANAANTAVLAAGGTPTAAANAAAVAQAAVLASAPRPTTVPSLANLAGGLSKLRRVAPATAAAQAAQEAVVAAGGSESNAAQAAASAVNSSAAATAAHDAVVSSGESESRASEAANQAASLAVGVSTTGNMGSTVLASGGSADAANAAQSAEVASLAAGVNANAAANAGVQAAALASPAESRSQLIRNIEAQRSLLKPVVPVAPLPAAEQQLVNNIKAQRAALTPPAPLAPSGTAAAPAPVPGQPLLNPVTSGAYVAPATGANRLAAIRQPYLNAARSISKNGTDNVWDPNANGPSAGAQTAAAASARYNAASSSAAIREANSRAQAEAAAAATNPAGLFGNNTFNYEPTPETAKKVQKIKNYMEKEVTNKEDRKDKMKNSIKFVKEFLEKDDSPRSKALLEYLTDKYNGQTMSALEGEMDKKHIPVLNYILTLATYPDLEFIKGLDTPIPGLFEKTDLDVRSNIITKVTPTFSGAITKMLATIKGSLQEKRAQAGGRRKTRCGCGLKMGGRRTRRVVQRKTRKSRR